MEEQRQQLLTWIEEARQAGARKATACDIVGLSVRTVQRWEKADNLRDGRLDADHQPRNKLDDVMRQRIIEVVNQTDYAALPPNKIVPLLADKEIYIASESTFYRVLKAEGLAAHRQKSRPAQRRQKPKAWVARGSNQVFSWDITYLPTIIKGLFFYLYLMMDIYTQDR